MSFEVVNKDIFKDRILILDGGFGTMLQGFSLKEDDFHSGVFASVSRELRGNNECLNLTHPEIVESIHRQYIEAGADIIETNSFSASRISQKEYDCEDFAPQMALCAAQIARKAADEGSLTAGRRIFVAGSVGPTSKSLSLAPDINDPSMRVYSFDQMAEAFSEQIGNLILGGVDMLIIETCFDALNTKAALYALQKLQDEGKAPAGFPVIVSASSNDRSGRTLTGQTLEAFFTSVRHYPLLAFGINCSLGADEMTPLLKEIASFSDVPVVCYPNAGLPNEMGGYDQSAEDMANAVRAIAGSGIANILGGCCGTTPEHIRAIAELAREYSPRPVPDSGMSPLQVSGLESVTIDLKKNNFTNIGERTNVAGSRKFAKLIAAGEYDTALQIASQQIENGASVIDINMDDAMLDSPVEMLKFVRHIQNDPAVAKAALMIDSSHWESILAGLKNAQGKCIVNSISLKEGEEPFLAKAKEIKALGAAVVVMAFDEIGQATTYERKIEICKRAYDLLTIKAGFNPTDIIFDVNVLSIGTGIREHALYGIDFIKAVSWIKGNLPGALTSGGISNLSFAFRGNNTVREAMHSAFLYHAIREGLDMGIVNPGMIQVYDDVEPELLKCVEDVIFNRDEEATERLITKAQAILEQKQREKEDPNAAPKQADTTPKDVRDRLKEALVKGSSATLEADVIECFNTLGSAVDVIEGPLMAGMEKVGELFGDGKMFLPQVVKSAKVMRDCVKILEPYMVSDSDSAKADKPKIINATVKGDVHDIGKNIMGIVMSCNGFEVIDLGVMVDKETILDRAQAENADIIGASGLITPSLFQMEELCREMTRRGMSTPLFIGGATTSALHTAVKLAPLYDHVFYGADASATAVMGKRYLSDPVAFEAAEHEQQKKIRDLYAKGKAIREESKKRGDTNTFDKDSFLKDGQHSLQTIPTETVSIDQVMPFFDWRMFTAVWGFKYGETRLDTPEVRKVIAEATAIIDRFKRDNEIIISLSVLFRNAHRDGDDIVLDNGTVLPMMRQEDGKKISLADFVADKQMGFDSPLGMFAISVRRAAAHPSNCDCPACSSEYESMMERSVRVTLAEAASLYLDSRIKAMIDREDIRITKPAAGYASCPDHTLKGDILSMLPDAEKLGISLTESYAMIPDASICGFIIAHPEAGYPEIRAISQDLFDDYARRRGMDSDRARQFLSNLLG